MLNTWYYLYWFIIELFSLNCLFCVVIFLVLTVDVYTPQEILLLLTCPIFFAFSGLIFQTLIYGLNSIMHHYRKM